MYKVLKTFLESETKANNNSLKIQKQTCSVTKQITCIYIGFSILCYLVIYLVFIIDHKNMLLFYVQGLEFY